MGKNVRTTEGRTWRSRSKVVAYIDCTLGFIGIITGLAYLISACLVLLSSLKNDKYTSTDLGVMAFLITVLVASLLSHAFFISLSVKLIDATRHEACDVTKVATWWRNSQLLLLPFSFPGFFASFMFLRSWVGPAGAVLHLAIRSPMIYVVHKLLIEGEFGDPTV